MPVSPFAFLEVQVSYRNKTYVIFDADNDRWAYAFMKGWKSNANMDFNFHDAHDIGPITDRASDETIKDTTEGEVFKCEASRSFGWRSNQESPEVGPMGD